MADRRYTIVFYAAILTAAGATFAVYRTLEATKAESRIETQPVVVAAADMPEGTPLSQANLVVANWPVSTVPAGAFSSADSLLTRVTRVSVFKGEPIVPGRLAPQGTAPGVEVKIADGKRATTVRINDVAGISGMIQPNSRVDILVTLRDTPDGQEPLAKLFMENMRVLAVGAQVDRDANGKPISAATVTLEVTPKEAEELAIASNMGAIQMVLRGYGSTDSVKTKGTTVAEVLRKLQGPAAVAPTRAAPAPRRSSGPSRPATRAPAPEPKVVAPAAPAPAPVPASHEVKVWRAEKASTVKFDTTKTPPPR